MILWKFPMAALAAALMADNVCAAEPALVLIDNGNKVPIGAWVVTLPAEPLCNTATQAESYYRMSIEQHSRGVPAGCVMLTPGSEVQIIKQDTDNHACVAPRGQSDCRECK